MNPYTLMELPPINDCPFCRQGEAILNDGNHTFWVTCQWCNADGPDHKDRTEAIKAWNGPTNEMDVMNEQFNLLRADADRLRRELDDERGIIR